MDYNFWIGLIGIIGIDILLAGDNAIVIALACRGLPDKQRWWGIILGSTVAVGLRVIFVFIVTILLKIPFLKLVGGLLLVWIAIKLLTDNQEDNNIPSSDKLWKAVQTIAVADVVMSLDNVIAITAMAKGDTTLIVLGLLISIPLVVAGAQLIMKLLDNYPWVIWLGAALLGYLAGEMMITDIKIIDILAKIDTNLVAIDSNPLIGRTIAPLPHYLAGFLGAAFVVATAWFIKSKQGHKSA